MIIYIVRHGQTEENQKRILQGHMPGTLTEQGKEQVYKNEKWSFPLTDNPAETEEQIAERARKALELLSEQYPDDNVIVVTHGMFARFMIAAHFDCSYKEVTSFVNAEIRILRFDYGRTDYDSRSTENG